MSALFMTAEGGQYHLADEQAILAEAAQIAVKRMAPGMLINGPKAVRQYLPALLGARQHETFCVGWMDTHNKLIKFEEMYQGSLAEARVYPREVVKRGLELNAAYMFIVHNHPSGSPKPSEADIELSLQIRLAASLFDITMVDHFLVAGDQVVSFQDKELLTKQAMWDFVERAVGPDRDMGQLLMRQLLFGGRS